MQLVSAAKVMDTTAYCDDPGVYAREREAERVGVGVGQSAPMWSPARVSRQRRAVLAAHAAIQELSECVRGARAGTVGEWIDGLGPNLETDLDTYELRRSQHEHAKEDWFCCREVARRGGAAVTWHSTLEELAELARQVLKSLP